MIVSISSDIGFETALDWIDKGFNVCGTYRTKSEKTKELKKRGVKLFHCDLSKNKSIKYAVHKLKDLGSWDVLVLAAGTQRPVGLFQEIKFSEWKRSITENFLGQFEILHSLLEKRLKSQKQSSVICFAGGGTNNATTHYSAYTISKIASMKFCELLDAEINDTKFTILGPGWVNTKIHKDTLESGTRAGRNFEKTVMKIKNNDMNSIENVIDCINWVIESTKDVVGGRNFSVVNDLWRSNKMTDFLLEDKDAYKLRRFKNDFVIY